MQANVFTPRCVQVISISHHTQWQKESTATLSVAMKAGKTVLENK
jgi:hypothetical protein